MEDEGSSSHAAISGGGGDGNHGRRYTISLNPSAFIRSPVAALLEYSGLFSASESASSSSSSSSVASPSTEEETGELLVSSSSSTNIVTTTGSGSGNGEEEVRIRIIGGPESEEDQSAGLPSSSLTGGPPVSGGDSGVSGQSSGNEGSSSSSSYQRYDIQNLARWVEQILPFSLLLVLVFIRQHLQGFCVALWIAVVLYKSNEVLRKQTALKGERRMSVLLSVISVLLLHVVVVYWWYADDGLLSPLLLVPPKDIPLFWHGVFIIVVNDVMVRLIGMALKCVLLLYYKNSRGQNYRKQGQILTLLEYILLVYRTLLPTPVWYRFFLNKEYGSFFSSLVTGLYLTIKLLSVLSKVQLFLAAFRALSRKEMHYGSCATAEQVNAAGDLCAICQEKMRSPILLRCKHIFCEECVSEWFERERTCPLCRALVKPADIRSFSDGSTSLLFQLF